MAVYLVTYANSPEEEGGHHVTQSYTEGIAFGNKGNHQGLWESNFVVSRVWCPLVPVGGWD